MWLYNYPLKLVVCFMEWECVKSFEACELECCW
jgi:hypothetical protein